MKQAHKGEVRRSQLVTTYGVGAIVAVEDESFMIAGIDRWPVAGPNLQEPRLERQLGVSGFATPPAGPGDQDIPVVRFPEMVWCPGCTRLEKHRFLAAHDDNRCRHCDTNLVPSRFVIACAKGHIDDFPYFQWVHKGKQPTGDSSHKLSIESSGNTASLRSISIKCSCGLSETMDGALAKTALLGIIRCAGSRPWLTSADPEPCDQTPRALQRGASNVWFSAVQSAISIPPWSEGAHKLLNKYWPVLQHIPDNALRETLAGMTLPLEQYTVEDLLLAVRQRRESAEDNQPWSAERLRRQEYEALERGKKENSKDQDFVCEVAPISASASRWFDRVMLVKRLREVRVLETFSRIMPSRPSPQAPAPSLFDQRPNWLPGIEVIGEGVFFRLAPKRLASWELVEEVVERAERIDRSYRQSFEERNLPPDRVITPRLILIHTLAHALISEWSLDAGYPAASLRERLFVGTDMGGLLLYTATSDAAGSLGGVTAQADEERLDATLRAAVKRAVWCSADPVCIESDVSGVDALNLAACHSCALLPEVSCEERNVLLDRAMLVGIPGRPELAYFRELVEES